MDAETEPFCVKPRLVCPGLRNKFMGFETDEFRVKAARDKNKHDSRIAIFHHSFLREEATTKETRAVEVFLQRVRTNCFYIHYFNNYNYRMSEPRRNGVTLESLLAKQVDEEIKDRALVIPNILRDECVPDVFLCLQPIPKPDHWCHELVTVDMNEKGLAVSWDYNLTEVVVHKYTVTQPLMVDLT